MNEATCFKKEKSKGKYRYHFFILDKNGKEITRFGIENKIKLDKKQLSRRANLRLKKFLKIYEFKI